MSVCPDYMTTCRAPAAKQRLLAPAERDKISGPAAQFAHKAEICSACHLVFTRRPLRRLGLLLGSFEPFRGY
jgi:hypothetical protein